VFTKENFEVNTMYEEHYLDYENNQNITISSEYPLKDESVMLSKMADVIERYSLGEFIAHWDCIFMHHKSKVWCNVKFYIEDERMMLNGSCMGKSDDEEGALERALTKLVKVVIPSRTRFLPYAAY